MTFAKRYNIGTTLKNKERYNVIYPWLEPHYQQIITALQQGHRHHALLLKSEAGLGVEQLIAAVGAWLMCENPSDVACGQCHSCHLRKAENHPDIYQLASIDGKDIGVEQVREINEKVAQHAKQNGNKLVLIKGVERLTEAAANGLLKTLEEPRPHTYFLLQGDASAAILPTIYSRCQVHLIPVPNTELVLDWLQKQLPADQDYSTPLKQQEIQVSLQMSYGRPLTALVALQQSLVEKRREFLRQFWLFYRRCSPLELLPHFDNELVIEQVDWIISFLSDALKSRLNIQNHWLCSDIAKGVQQFGANQSEIGLLKAIQIMQNLRHDLTQINGVNQELILLDGLTRLITEVFEG